MNKPNKDYQLIAVITHNEQGQEYRDGGMWIRIHNLPSDRNSFRIATNNDKYYNLLDRELEYKQFDDSKELLEDRLAAFANRHNLPLFWHIRDGQYTLIEVE